MLMTKWMKVIYICSVRLLPVTKFAFVDKKKLKLKSDEEYEGIALCV